MRIIRELSLYPPIENIFSQIQKKQKEEAQKDSQKEDLYADAVFLDSSLRGDLGQYSIIALKPYLKLEKSEQFFINGIPGSESFEEYVRTYLNEHFEENETDLPLVSGAIGYFSYDYGCQKEGVRYEKAPDIRIPECVLTFYDLFLLEDHQKNRFYLVANGHTAPAEEMMLFLENLVAGCGFEPMSVPEEMPPAAVEADFTKEEYLQAVRNMIQYIIEGDIYVVNMTQQLRVDSVSDPYEVFLRLRKNNPSPFGGYLSYQDFQIICASPERFMKMKDRHIYTRPIKGTRKRGATPEEDLRYKEELANSEKDQSELLMIVDLERNDLNRVCVPGSVQVTELFSVETYATVFHLVANVEGELQPERNAMDLMQAAFPGGSITGAPKLRAMELICQEEHNRRNLYTGSIGYLSLNGDCDFNIVIRTAVHKGDAYYIGVGGGITCESELEFEYEETWQKARALLEAIGVTKW